MNNNFEKIDNSQKRKKDDEFFVIRHSISEYKLNEGIIKSDNPEAAPSADKQWFNSDLTSEGIKLAQEKAQEFFAKLNPGTDALFFVSSDLVRAAETAKIYLDIARENGFEVIISAKKEKSPESKNKAEEIGEGYIRKIDCLSLDHLENMLREQIFQPKDYLKEIENLDKVSTETKEKWTAARKIIEEDNQKTWGENYAAHSEEIQKIFPNVKSAKEVYESKFKNLLRLVRFGQEKINQRQPEKNIKVLAFSHENSFLYFLNENFGESMKNCENIAFKIADSDDKETSNISVTAKGQTKEINS
ncbi:MAG: hypothetical protein WC863_03015 [Patescibacteria group bacterium]